MKKSTTRHYLSHQRGYLVMLAVLLIMVIGFIGTALVKNYAANSLAMALFHQGDQALFLADSGIEHATHELMSYQLGCSGLSVSNTLGGGSYSVTTTGPYYVSSPTTLNGALNATATTVPVSSTANYKSAGSVMIDQEIMSYASTDSTDFLGVTRGLGNSTPTTHSSGAPVGQFQCNLTSQGGLPNLTSPIAKRTITDTFQLVEGWSVGYSSGGSIGLIRWNNPTTLQWQNYSPAISNSGNTLKLRSVSMTSYVDGWAVGGPNTGQTGNSLFYHWNGSSWTAASLSGIPSTVTYTSVFCWLNTNCLAVGMNSGSGNPTIVFWNGTSWSNPSSFSGTVSNDNLYAVSCNPTNCWAVGDKNATGVYYVTSDSADWTGYNVSGTLNSFPYKGVFCNTSTDCWAVGSNNVFARLNGSTTAWTTVTASALPSTSTYYGIWCNATNDCWAAGDAGAIGHWNGSSWTQYTSPTTNNLRYVMCTGTNYCYISGINTPGNSAMLFWNGVSWAQMTLNSTVPNVEFDGLFILGPTAPSLGPISQPLSIWAETYA